ncbi:MAG: thioesterase family protein [Desulfitobacteriaceae bacterium]|nr:thioesterase family protein [Desulfitobacteriaceae bacterium]MDD4346674.1 thioesterase family protein [Desulfitobacteriaceae bacterium]MDD4400591.1 thioesterase family protein [Desulfitobacteriaceae bacterium]
MKFSGKTSFRVRYAETDKMGIVYHANYLVWFEVGRSELFRDLNLPYTIFEEQDLELTIIEASCRYRQSAHYDDEITVITRVNIFSRKVTFSYLVYRDSTLLAEGKTVHLFINRQGRVINAHSHPLWQKMQSAIEKREREDS